MGALGVGREAVRCIDSSLFWAVYFFAGISPGLARHTIGRGK